MNSIEAANNNMTLNSDKTHSTNKMNTCFLGFFEIEFGPFVNRRSLASKGLRPSEKDGFNWLTLVSNLAQIWSIESKCSVYFFFQVIKQW